MRDPERINVIVHWLLCVWRKEPQLRFGQLISNVACIDKPKRLTETEMFHLEDIAWEQRFYKRLVELEEFHKNKGDA